MWFVDLCIRSRCDTPTISETWIYHIIKIRWYIGMIDISSTYMIRVEKKKMWFAIWKLKICKHLTKKKVMKWCNLSDVKCRD